MAEPYTLPADVQKSVDKFEKGMENVEAEIIKQSYKLQKPLFDERDESLKKVDRFWLNALQNCMPASMYVDDEDRDALEFLVAVRVDRNAEDPREATLHFDFAENEYFSDSTLSRSFKVKKDAPALGSDEFEFGEHIDTAPTTIHWKSEENNLAKTNPFKYDENDDDLDEVQAGSLFSSLFENKLETMAATIGDIFMNELYPRAVNFYTGVGIPDYDDGFDEYDEDDEDDDLDEDEDDEEDEESDEDKTKEIDLEDEDERPKKKSKN